MVTLRKFLRFNASIFDPLGFMAQLTIRVRKSLQAAWNHGPKWDKPMNLNEFADLTQLQNEILDFREVSLPHCLFINKAIKEKDIHMFSDASDYALSAVLYLRIEYLNETVPVKFIMGKIPRSSNQKNDISKSRVASRHLRSSARTILERRARHSLKGKSFLV